MVKYTLYSKERAGTSCIPREGLSTPCIPREGLGTLCIPRVGLITPCISREGLSTPYIPREGLSTPCIPREGLGTPCIPREGFGTPCIPREGFGTPCIPREGLGNPNVPQICIIHAYESMRQTVSLLSCDTLNISKLSFFHLIIWVRFLYFHLTAQIFILNNLFCLFIFLWFFTFLKFFYRFWWLLYRQNWRGSTQTEIYFQ